MGRKHNAEPPPAAVPTPAIDHLFDGAADPARPHGDHPRDADADPRPPDDA
jgi:hypothetical protein